MFPSDKKLTGILRHKFIMEWIKRGGNKYMDKEEFVKKACEKYSVTYSPPPVIERNKKTPRR